MGTEVLRPQNCLIERIRVPPAALYSRRRNNNNNVYNYGHYYPNPNYRNNYSSNNNYSARPSHRKPAVRNDRSVDNRRQRCQSEPTFLKRSISDETKLAKRWSADDLRVVRSKDHSHNKKNGYDLAMEKVTILRRGESLDSMIKNGGVATSRNGGEGLIVTDTVQLGPEPDMVPKQIRIVDLKTGMIGKSDVYAGSAFAVSPEPSSLPLPSFSKKKQVPIDDSATRDIKRLLRLN